MPNDPSQWTMRMPFATPVGVEVTAASATEVRGRLEWRPERCTTNGILHGAALMALADSLGAVCAVLNIPEEPARRRSSRRPTSYGLCEMGTSRRRPDHFTWARARSSCRPT